MARAVASRWLERLRPRLLRAQAFAWHLCVLATPLVAEDAAMLALMFS